MQIDALRMGFRSFGMWTGAVTAVLIRETDVRIGKRGGTVAALLEPVTLILVTSGMHLFLGALPAFGTSVLLFYSTGILPHYMFVWISARGKSADSGLAHFPREQFLDQVIAQVLLELTIILMATVGIFLALWLYGISEALPVDLFSVLGATLFLALFGFAFALINAVTIAFFPLWRALYHVLVRGALLLSGVFFVPDFMPPSIRYWLSWIPMVHGIIWFRRGFYARYPDQMLDKTYMIEVTLIAMVFAMTLERVTRRRRGLG